MALFLLVVLSFGEWIPEVFRCGSDTGQLRWRLFVDDGFVVYDSQTFVSTTFEERMRLGPERRFIESNPRLRGFDFFMISVAMQDQWLGLERRTHSTIRLSLWGFAILFLALGVASGLTRMTREWVRVKGGRCKKCGYDLRGTVSTRCPECGDSVPTHL